MRLKSAHMIILFTKLRRTNKNVFLVSSDRKFRGFSAERMSTFMHLMRENKASSLLDSLCDICLYAT